MSLHPTDLHPGRVFYESCQYGNVRMTVLNGPYGLENGAYAWQATTDDGEVVDYYWTGKSSMPAIYDEPAYVGVPTR